MSTSDSKSDGLEKLLADVQRTIRENELFIRHLKDEAIDTDLPETEPEDELASGTTDDSATEEYEEL